MQRYHQGMISLGYALKTGLWKFNPLCRSAIALAIAVSEIAKAILLLSYVPS